MRYGLQFQIYFQLFLQSREEYIQVFQSSVGAEYVVPTELEYNLQMNVATDITLLSELMKLFLNADL